MWRIEHGSNFLELPNLFFPEHRKESFFDSGRIPDRAFLCDFPELGKSCASVNSLPGKGLAGQDIFGTVFFLLTCFEEHLDYPRDEHDRLASEATWLVRNSLQHRPVVDELLEVLLFLLKGSGISISRRPADYSFHYSCDVDCPAKWHGAGVPAQIRILLGALKKRSWGGLKKRAAAMSRLEADPAFTFYWILDVLEENGAKGAFYFKSGASSARYDVLYSLESAWAKRLIHEVDGRGHEVGFHPSYMTVLDEELFKQEFRVLRQAFSGNIDGDRQHFLRFLGASTWRMWEACDLRYDSTAGYSRKIGFKCGTAHEFPAYDLERRKELGLRERPLLAMDVAFLNTNQTFSDMFDAVASIGNQVKKFGGNMTLLWHNSVFETEDRKELFTQLIKHLM